MSEIEKGRIPQLTSAPGHSALIWTFPALFAGKLETLGTKSPKFDHFLQSKM